MSLAIVNGTVILPDRLLEGAAVMCADGGISAVGSRDKIPTGIETIDARGGYISPGFVDIHIHGGAGADFMDGTTDAVRKAIGCHTRHGTTTVFPTTTTGSPEQIQRMLLACKRVRDSWTPKDGAGIGGVHFYGPYFAEDKVGCHLKSGRRDPLADEYRKAFDLGIVQISTCAAELPGAEDFYHEASRRGHLVTCGHSNASWTEMQRAFDAGMRHVDHFWCAMSSVPSMRERLGTPMQGSMAEFVLMNREMSTEVIADGQHLAPELLEFAYRMIGPDRLCLVTDANRAVDMPAGDYRFGPAEDGEMFRSNGKVGFQPGKGLASAVVCLDSMIRIMKRDTSASLPEIIRMASLTPARRAGVGNTTGSIEVGKQADLLVLDRELHVQNVMIGGHLVPARNEPRP